MILSCILFDYFRTVWFYCLLITVLWTFTESRLLGQVRACVQRQYVSSSVLGLKRCLRCRLPFTVSVKVQILEFPYTCSLLFQRGKGYIPLKFAVSTFVLEMTAQDICYQSISFLSLWTRYWLWVKYLPLSTQYKESLKPFGTAGLREL